MSGCAATWQLRLNDTSFITSRRPLQLGSARCGYLEPAPEIIRAAGPNRPLDLIHGPLGGLPGAPDRGRVLDLHNPADMPGGSRSPVSRERIKATIFRPTLIGLALLCEERGAQQDLTYAGSRAVVVYRLP